MDRQTHRANESVDKIANDAELGSGRAESDATLPQLNSTSFNWGVPTLVAGSGRWLTQSDVQFTFDDIPIEEY